MHPEARDLTDHCSASDNGAMTLPAPHLPFSLDPLIREAKRRMRRRRLLAVLAVPAIAATAAGAYALAGNNRGVGATPPSTSAANATYSVVASVLHIGSAKGKPFERACFSSDAVLPPQGCGGVRVTGYPFDRINGGVRYSGNEWRTPMLHLVGDWNGNVFRVTSASRASLSEQTIPAQPNCLSHRTGSMVRPSAQAIARADARVQMLQAGPCGHTYSFLVGAADRHTMSYLQRQFGKSILVAGWLQPARP